MNAVMMAAGLAALMAATGLSTVRDAGRDDSGNKRLEHDCVGTAIGAILIIESAAIAWYLVFFAHG